MIINYINNTFTKLICWYIKWRFSTKFQSIKDKVGIINPTVSLGDLFNHLINAYQMEYKEHGIKGIYNLRKAMVSQINGLSIGNVYNKDKQLSDLEVKDTLKYLYVYKDILANIKFTLEVFLFIKIIMNFISKAAFIPFLVLYLWDRAVKMFRGVAYVTTAYMAKC